MYALAHRLPRLKITCRTYNPSATLLVLTFSAPIRSKLKLYASLHSTLADQRAVLSRREETLKDARETLLRDGGNVVSGKITAE